MPNSEERDVFLESLDEPRHALEYGGINGLATIHGVPTGSSNRPGEAQSRNRQVGVVMEPVPVLMRDAVTIDTAVRLTGISRITLQRAAQAGNLPVMKMGPDNAPYIVRLRDVVTYLTTMWTERRYRRESPTGRDFIGFPDWLVREVAESWPENRPYRPGKWEGRAVKLNRGGRPRGYSPGKGYSVNGKKLGRPRKAEAVFLEDKKEGPLESNHPQEALPSVPATPEQIDRTKLPKWHPLWVRPGT